MITDLSTYYERLRASYWFIPGLLILGSMILAFVTVAIDDVYTSSSVPLFGWIDISDPTGAHGFLSVVAGSMIGVVGITFSITIVALVQASSQFGPRIMNTFLRDQGNQFVLGFLLATYTFCLLIMRSVANSVDLVFVPRFSLLVALFLSIFSVLALVYFLHHTIVSLQAEHVIASLGRDLEQSIERLFPEASNYSTYGHHLKRESDLPSVLETEPLATIGTDKAGYLQVIDIPNLVRIAAEENLYLQALHRPGDFIQNEGILIHVWAASFDKERLERKINNSFILGDQRLRISDVEFLLNQLVEIAVRALSSGINAPFTAMTCVDQLGSALTGLMTKAFPEGYHYDSQGVLRLRTDSLSFSGIINAAFNQIRQNAYSSVAVTIRLLDAILAMAPHVRIREQKRVLLRQAEMLNRSGKAAAPEVYDQEDIQKRYDQVALALKK